MAFAITALHELARAGGSTMTEDLSEEALYWSCKQIDGHLADGTAFVSANGALRKWGQPIEEVWPYDSWRDESSAYQPPMATKAGGPDWYRHGLAAIGLSLDSLRAELAQDRLVALGLILTLNFYCPVDGWIETPSRGAPSYGLHAVALVGYDDARRTNEGGFLVRNSWGLSWGQEGYAWLPYSYVTTFGREAWVASV